MSKKIALVEPVGGHGGMNHYDMAMMRALVRCGWECSWYTCDKSSECNENGISVYKFYRHVFGKSSKFFRLWRYFVGMAKTGFHILNSGISLVHVHTFHVDYLDVASACLFKLLGLKIVSTVHDVESFSGRNRKSLSKIYYKIVDKVIVHNFVCREQLNNILKSYSLHKDVIIVPHGNYIDSTRCLDRSIARQKLDIGLSDEDFVFLFFGQIKTVKGLDLLIESFAKLVNSGCNAKLVIAGRVWKDSYEKYQNLIDAYSIQDSVVSKIEYIPDECVPLYFSSSDIVVLPYKKIFQSGVLIQAMGYKRAVITSDLPAMMEMVQDGVNGYLFESGNAESLCKTLRRAITEDNKLVAESAYEMIRSEYSWDRVALLLDSIYMEIMQ